MLRAFFGPWTCPRCGSAGWLETDGKIYYCSRCKSYITGPEMRKFRMLRSVTVLTLILVLFILWDIGVYLMFQGKLDWMIP